SLLPVGGQPGRCMAGREELGHALDGNRQPGFAAERLPGLLEALEREDRGALGGAGVGERIRRRPLEGRAFRLQGLLEPRGGFEDVPDRRRGPVAERVCREGHGQPICRSVRISAAAMRSASISYSPRAIAAFTASTRPRSISGMAAKVFSRRSRRRPPGVSSTRSPPAGAGPSALREGAAAPVLLVLPAPFRRSAILPGSP